MEDERKRKRRDANTYFVDIQRKLENYGQSVTPESEKNGRSVNGRDVHEKIRALQKEAKKVIAWQIRDNRAYGESRSKAMQ